MDKKELQYSVMPSSIRQSSGVVRGEKSSFNIMPSQSITDKSIVALSVSGKRERFQHFFLTIGNILLKFFMKTKQSLASWAGKTHCRCATDLYRSRKLQTVRSDKNVQLARYLVNSIDKEGRHVTLYEDEREYAGSLEKQADECSSLSEPEIRLNFSLTNSPYSVDDSIRAH